MSRATQLGRVLGAALTAQVLDRLPRPARRGHEQAVPSPLFTAPRSRRRDGGEGADGAPAPPEPSPSVRERTTGARQTEPAAPTRAPAGDADRLGAFMDRFCHYRGDYARQWKGVDKETGEVTYGWARTGKRRPDACALTREVVEAHLRGHITAGTYLLDERDHCRLLVLDHDDKRTLPELDPATGRPRVIEEDGLALLQDCRRRLEEQGIESAIGESRRGGHLFVFLDEAVPARDARALAMLALGADEVERMHAGHEAFEIYPKQDHRSGRDGSHGPGSNIALPLGVHLKDGERHPFIDRHGAAVAPTLSGQIDHVASIARCPARDVLRDRPWLYQELDRATHPARAREPRPGPGRAREGEQGQHAHAARRKRPVAPLAPTSGAQGRPSVIARWKEGVDCRDVVERLTGQALADHGDYASGRCPFHDDKAPSLLVFKDGWRCLAEERGGDALAFIGEHENMAPKEALAYARERFPVPGLDVMPGGRG